MCLLLTRWSFVLSNNPLSLFCSFFHRKKVFSVISDAVIFSGFFHLFIFFCLFSEDDDDDERRVCSHYYLFLTFFPYEYEYQIHIYLVFDSVCSLIIFFVSLVSRDSRHKIIKKRGERGVRTTDSIHPL